MATSDSAWDDPSFAEIKRWSSTGERHRTAQSVVDAMITSGVRRGDRGVGDSRPAYSGYLRKRSFWGWKTLWVQVRLGGGASVSTVEYSSTPGISGAAGAKRVDLFRSDFINNDGMGAIVHKASPDTSVCNSVTVAVVRPVHPKDVAVTFTIKKKAAAWGAKEVVEFQTIPGRTPPALITALASLGWPLYLEPRYRSGASVESGLYPGLSGDKEEVLLHALLVNLGDTRLAVSAAATSGRRAARAEVVAHLKSRGLVEVHVGETERPGDVAGDADQRYGPVHVPPGVRPGAVFHLPRAGQEPNEAGSGGALGGVEVVQAIEVVEDAAGPAVVAAQSRNDGCHNGQWVLGCSDACRRQLGGHGWGNAREHGHWTCCGQMRRDQFACSAATDAAATGSPLRPGDGAGGGVDGGEAAAVALALGRAAGRRLMDRGACVRMTRSYQSGALDGATVLAIVASLEADHAGAGEAAAASSAASVLVAEAAAEAAAGAGSWAEFFGASGEDPTAVVPSLAEGARFAHSLRDLADIQLGGGQGAGQGAGNSCGGGDDDDDIAPRAAAPAAAVPAVVKAKGPAVPAAFVRDLGDPGAPGDRGGGGGSGNARPATFVRLPSALSAEVNAAVATPTVQSSEVLARAGATMLRSTISGPPPQASAAQLPSQPPSQAEQGFFGPLLAGIAEGRFGANPSAAPGGPVDDLVDDDDDGPAPPRGARRSTGAVELTAVSVVEEHKLRSLSRAMGSGSAGVQSWWGTAAFAGELSGADMSGTWSEAPLPQRAPHTEASNLGRSSMVSMGAIIRARHNAQIAEAAASERYGPLEHCVVMAKRFGDWVPLAAPSPPPLGAGPSIAARFTLAVPRELLGAAPPGQPPAPLLLGFLNRGGFALEVDGATIELRIGGRVGRDGKARLPPGFSARFLPLSFAPHQAGELVSVRLPALSGSYVVATATFRVPARWMDVTTGRIPEAMACRQRASSSSSSSSPSSSSPPRGERAARRAPSPPLRAARPPYPGAEEAGPWRRAMLEGRLAELRTPWSQGHIKVTHGAFLSVNDLHLNCNRVGRWS